MRQDQPDYFGFKETWVAALREKGYRAIQGLTTDKKSTLVKKNISVVLVRDTNLLDWATTLRRFPYGILVNSADSGGSFGTNKATLVNLVKRHAAKIGCDYVKLGIVTESYDLSDSRQCAEFMSLSHRSRGLRGAGDKASETWVLKGATTHGGKAVSLRSHRAIQRIYAGNTKLALKVRSRTVRDEIANKKARSDLNRRRNAGRGGAPLVGRQKAKNATPTGPAGRGGGGDTGGGSDGAAVVAGATKTEAQGPPGGNGPDAAGVRGDKSKFCTAKSRRRLEIAQRYVSGMLTLNNRKFDVRAFVLVASTKPMLVYVFNQVYFRASLSNLTDTSSTTKGQHVTNTHVQKKALQDWEDHIWNPDRVTRYAAAAGLGADFLHTVQQHIKRSCQFLLDAAAPSFRNKRAGQWRLYGFDYVIDREMQPWLVDTNHFPGFDWTRTPWSKRYASGMLRSMWQLLLDVHLGRHNKRRATPREGGWELIYREQAY